MKQLFRQSTRFAAVGVANTTIGLAAIYAAMFLFQAGPALANATGYAVGVCFSFFANRSWTFGSSLAARRALPKFILVIAFAYIMNLGVVIAATTQLRVNPYAAQLLGISIYALLSFIGCRSLVFTSAGEQRASH